MKRIILIFFLITGCAVDQAKKEIDVPEIKFSDDLSLEQFKADLEVYANNNSYPNIDN